LAPRAGLPRSIATRRLFGAERFPDSGKIPSPRVSTVGRSAVTDDPESSRRDSGGEEGGDRDEEARQVRLGREGLQGVKHLRLRTRPVDDDRAENGVDHPDDRHPGFEVQGHLRGNLFLLIRGREDFDG